MFRPYLISTKKYHAFHDVLAHASSKEILCTEHVVACYALLIISGSTILGVLG